MKNAKLLVCTLIMITGSAQLMSDPILKATELSQNQMISLCDLDDRVIQEFSDGKMRELIIECTEGTRLPFSLSLRGDFLALEHEAVPSLYLKLLKTCYVRCDGKENFLFSTDLQTWEGFSEFFTGELRLSVGTENGEPEASLQLELNQRKN